MKPIVLTLALSIAPAAPAAADEPDYSAEYSSCMDDSGGVTADMIDCIGQELERQDARLNKVYNEFMAALTAERKEQLRSAQRAWLKFRDENCKFYDDPDGGSIARVSANVCVLSATAARADELAGLAEGASP